MLCLWRRLTFFGRLLAVAGVALVIAGLSMVLVSARQEAADIREDLRQVLERELETLPATLSETVVVGDFATLEQTLAYYVDRPLLVMARFRDATGAVLESVDAPAGRAAPDWFLAAFAYVSVEGATPVVVGGREYGELTLRLSPHEPARRAWQRLLNHLTILWLAVTIDFIGIWLVLYFGLRPLKRLGDATGQLAAGNLDVRLPEEGGPELRGLIVRFNEMAGAICTAQAALRESREQLKLAVDGSNDGIWDWNIEANTIYFSPRWKSMIGYADDELPSEPASFENNLHPDDKPAVLREIDRYVAGTSTSYRVEFRMRHKDGHWCWIMARGAALRDAAGKAFRMAGSHTDITEQKRSEDDLRRAKQRAETANSAKTRFLTTMSHELRTPMNGVLGMAQLLMMPRLEEVERIELARTLYASGETLMALLNDILDLSRIEAGKLELRAVDFSAADLIGEVAALFHTTAAAKGLTLAARWDGLPQAAYRGDSVRLHQMIANLVGNAVKFTPSGRIDIEAGEVSRAGGEAVLAFAVRDTGIGIPVEQQALLFKPFSQLDDSDNRTQGGSGLGLSIVSSLARLMGGDVGVDSTPGTGATFWFRVRVAVAGSQSPAAAPAERARPCGDATSRSAPAAPRVLLVEDNSINRMLAERMLARAGYAVTCVENGAQAVAAVTTDNGIFDLVLMDCQMPVMDGYEATRRIREWERMHERPRLPIIALTAAAFGADREHCLAVGMDDFVAKPIALDRLLETLRRWTAMSG